jgi:hypothetical protein
MPVAQKLSVAPFVLVTIDAKTENFMGKLPYDRSVYANALSTCKDHGAKAAVFLFPLDRANRDAGDDYFAKTLNELPVALEAVGEDDEKAPNLVLEKDFFHQALPKDNFSDFISFKSGIIPSPLFASRAHSVGFTNKHPSGKCPLFQKYQGHLVKTLFTCCLELATNSPVQLSEPQKARFGESVLDTDPDYLVSVELPKNIEIPIYSLVSLVHNIVPDDAIRGRVVIFTYEGEQEPLVDSPIGKTTNDRIFYATLEFLVGRLRSK